MAVEIHVSVAAAAAAAGISLMWHICGSWWRWSVSSAPRIYFFCRLVPLFRHVRDQVWRGVKDGVVIVAALLYPPPPKEVKLTKGRNGGTPRVASEGFSVRPGLFWVRSAHSQPPDLGLVWTDHTDKWMTCAPSDDLKSQTSLWWSEGSSRLLSPPPPPPGLQGSGVSSGWVVSLRKDIFWMTSHRQPDHFLPDQTRFGFRPDETFWTSLPTALIDSQMISFGTQDVVFVPCKG